MAMRSLGYMPSEVELAIIMQRLDMDGEPWACSGAPRDEPRLISETFRWISRLDKLLWPLL